MRPILKFLHTAIIVCALAGLAAAETKYRFDTWTTDNGLPQNGVRSITQTPDGYLWFTTFDGLVRFDGLRFSVFNKSNTKGIINNRFTAIFANSDGSIYASTSEDGILTVYKNGIFTSYTSDQVPGHYISEFRADADGRVQVLSEDDDRKDRSWFAFDDGKFTFLEKRGPLNTNINVAGKNGKSWTININGVTEHSPAGEKFYEANFSKIAFNAIPFVDSQGTLWLGENRVYRIRDGEMKVFSESEGLPASSLYHSFWEDEQGSVWFATGGGASNALGVVEISGDTPRFWGKEELNGGAIADVMVDREGVAWLATTRGLSRMRKQVIQGYSTAAGLDHSEIYPIFRSNSGDIWIGSTKGLTVYRDGKFQPVTFSPTASDILEGVEWKNGRMPIQALWEDKKGRMWVGLSGGLFLVENGIAERLLNGTHVVAIRDDKDGNIWAATNKGLLKFNDDRMVAQYSTKHGLPNEFMTFIHQDKKGVLWFGGYGGLSKYENGKFTNFSKDEGLTGNYVRTIYEDAEGTFWIGTYDEGMSRFKDGKFTNYREEHGLYNSGVFAIEEDKAGYFWISSNRGIYRVNRKELADFADGKISKINSVGYGKEDGMLSNECNGGRQPASLRDEQGRFWFPTQEGVAIVDPTLEQTSQITPNVVVEEIIVDRQPVNLNAGITIEPGSRDLEIRYTGLSLVRSSQIKFQYRLIGHDADWIDAGTDRTANYAYLPPGDYTFEVRAANSDGLWSDKSAQVGMVLKPFFYQTWTFVLLVIFGSALLLLVIWKVSVYQLEAREKKLTRLVAERTAELAEANKNLEALANSDGLTKIGNRRRFEAFLADEWHRAVRFRTEISLVMVDIDHFKQFNDTYGHQAGDECLQRVAEALAAAIKRPTDLVARFGGEEFAIILGGTDSAGAKTIAEEAIENIRALEVPHSTSGAGEFITVSVGIATVLGRLESSEIDLIRAADRMLYQAKQNGRNCIFMYDDFRVSSSSANILSEELLDVT